MSDCTSATSVSDLLRSPSRPLKAYNNAGKASIDVDKWAQDSISALGLSPPRAAGGPWASLAGTGGHGDEPGSPGVVQLKLEVASSTLAECKARNRQLEAQVRELRAELEEGCSGREAAKSSQALLLERIHELEAQLKKTADSEQAKVAQLARLEGRAAVAEGSLKAAEQQLSQALSELQAQRAKELGELEARHARELQQLGEQHRAALAQLKAGCEERVAELAKSTRAAEQAATREQQRSRDLAAQVERAQSKGVAVKELMRHSEELQAQVERLQQSLQEERRRANKVAQSAESALAAEKHLADAAAQELQLKMQDASREQEKAVRQAKAKLQRAEADLRGAKLHSGQLAAHVAELESLNAQKELQLDTAVQEVAAMQRELQALRQGLSSRDAAALEAARAQYAAELEGCRADLLAARRQLSEQALLVQRQSAALGSVADILAAHAEEGLGPLGVGEAQQGGLRPPVDPERVVAFVEAVSGTLADMQQQWELERQELSAALAAADAVRAQLEALLQQEREEGRQAVERHRGELEGARAGQGEAQRDLGACRAELTHAVAKAAAYSEECAKWRSAAEGLEAELRQAALAAEASQAQAAELKGLAAAKDERIKEMRSAMASAMDDKSNTASDLQHKLVTLQQAEQQLQECRAELGQYTAAAALVAEAAVEAVPKLQSLLQALETADAGSGERLSMALEAAVKPAVAGLQSLAAAPDSGRMGKLASLGGTVLQLCEGLGHVTRVMEERAKIHHIMSTVNAKLRSATTQHRSLLTAGEKGQGCSSEQGTASLLALLQQLTESVVGLIESLAVEKECIASEMMHVAEENQLLQNQIQSMQSVLASLQSDTNVEQQLADTLVSWNQAQARIAGLEADNAHLAQRLQQAQQAVHGMRASSSQEWGGMRDDIARLVQHAEQAQLDAEAAVARLKAECDERVELLQQEAAEAAAGRAAAEAAAADLGRQLTVAQGQLQQQSQAGTQAQENVDAALWSAQQGMQQLETQVAQLQRKLVARTRVGVSASALKKAAAASSKAALLKRENEKLRAQEIELRGKVASLESTTQQGAQQLKQSKEQAAAAQGAMSDAQAKVARLDALLRKVDERKASIEVERRKAQEAATRLEQQVLELQCKLETAQHRERMAQAEAERLRSALARRDQEAKQLSGAVQQVEVAEEALRDSHTTASKLLQECTEARRANQELQGQVNTLSRQLQDAKQGHAGAVQQVQDLQQAFDTALTELDIARALLAGQRQQEPGPGQSSHQEGRQPQFHQHAMAFPMVLGAASPNQEASQQAMDQVMKHILGAKNGKLEQARCTPSAQPGCSPAEHAEHGGAHPSPLTQHHIQTPCTPLTAQKGNCTSAPHISDDAGSHRPTPEPDGACADENWLLPAGQERQAPRAPKGLVQRPDSAASAASQVQQAVDVDDVRGLVLAVESLQRQLAVKNDRIKELRGALQEQQQAATGHNAGGQLQHGGSAEAFVLQQKLDAAMQQLESTQALISNLEMQLAEAQQAKRELQQQLSLAAAKLAAPAIAGAPRDGRQQQQQQLTELSSEPAVRQQLMLFEKQLVVLEQQVEAGQADLAAAHARADGLAVKLAERDALMEALQMQLASLASARSSAGTQTEEGEASGTAAAAAAVAVAAAAVRAASRPSSRAEEMPPASVQASGALGSLDRIVGLWKRACQVKDRQIRELQGRLAEAEDALAAAEAGHDALQQQAQDSTVALQSLEQLLQESQVQLVAAQSSEQDLGSRVARLEAELQSASEGLAACRKDLTEARRQQLGAERQCGSLQQQLEIAQAQVREVQHAAQLERASHGDGDVLRQQLAAARVELGTIREAAAASQQRAEALQQQLQEQRQAAVAGAAAASSTAASQLSQQLEIAREAERRLLREAQDTAAQLAVAQREGAELQRALAVRDAQLRQVCERLEAAEGQLREVLGALQDQNAALAEMQAALEQAREEHQAAAAIAGEQQQAVATLVATRQELALMQQRLEVADKQMEVLRAQLSDAEGDKARASAERRSLQALEARLNDSMLRYQTGLATLTSSLRQLQSADAEGGLDVLAVLGHYQGAGAQQGQHGAAEPQLPVEELVDEILFHVHRRDCDISALVAQVSQLEAAVASKTSEVAEQQGRLQVQLGSISRVKEQLQWCMRECEALKRQLADKDEQIARLRVGGMGASSGVGSLADGAAARSSAVGLAGWPSLQRQR